MFGNRKHKKAKVAKRREKGKKVRKQKDKAKLEARVRSQFGKIYDATVGKRMAKASLTDQVIAVRRLMKLPFADTRSVRKDLLEGLPTDIREKREAGLSDEAIKAYFWGNEAFKQLWIDLKIGEEIGAEPEAMWDTFMKESLEQCEKQPVGSDTE